MQVKVQSAFGIDELADAWRVSRSSLYRQMNAGLLGYIKLGGRRLVTQKQASDYLATLEKKSWR